MSIAKKAGLIIGVIGAAATAATAAEAGEGNGRKRYRDSPVYIVEQPVIVQRLAGLYRATAAAGGLCPGADLLRADVPARYDRYPSSPSVNINIPLR